MTAVMLLISIRSLFGWHSTDVANGCLFSLEGTLSKIDQLTTGVSSSNF